MNQYIPRKFKMEPDSTAKETSTLEMTLNQFKRKTLQSNHPSVSGNKLNGGEDGVLQIYEDVVSENSLKSRCSRLTQTDASLLDGLLHDRLHGTDKDDSGCISGYLEITASDLTGDEVSEAYWKGLDIERRRAIKETLAENDKLSARIEQFLEENKQLQERSDSLTAIAMKAEALEKVLGGMLSDDNVDAKSEDAV